MASSSSFASNSQHCPRWKYDVFLSFRGEDTRKTFTGHLYEGLRNGGIFTFQDDKRLEHGASISEELCKAIEESQVAVIIFSKNYATSRWCLDELVKIMECKTQFGQTVIPVFYDVDPSHVRNQRESFAEAFSKHESKFKDDVEGMQKVQRWRSALTEAANLKGCDIRARIESDCVQQIVNQISKLCKFSLSYLQDIVGINPHLEEVKSLLQIEINDVRIVGIWGMGGVGKTTIARAIFDTLSYQFEGTCFLANVKENKCGMHSLQNILLSELSRENANYVNNKEDGKQLMARRLRSKKVLVVLDDIDHRDHLEYLAGDLGWFGNGSRIIATTRDKHLIGKKDALYEMTTLADHEAIQLFNRYAFKEDVPDEFFEKLTLEVVSHAKGLPLALKVWGSLFHKRNITEWRSAILQMKKHSNSEIVDKLKISYDGLEPVEQAIFLDIACFLRGREKNEIIQILESCEFGADIGLRVLIDKSLVFISEKDTIEMHDLIQDMGKHVVNIQKDPGERSRLWLAEDFEEVMINNTGTKAMEAIWFLYLKGLSFTREGMKNMKRLRILYIRDGSQNIWADSICHNGSMEYLPNNLRWFVWFCYPWESLPSTFEPKKLVHLELQSSSLRYLWTEITHLPSLRKLSLSCCVSLMQTPDFTGMPNLEYLDLSLCSNFEELHYSLGCCRKLVELNLIWCDGLKRFPCVNVESLEHLELHGCSSLQKFPEMKNLSSIQYQTHITNLDLSFLTDLATLPSSICRLKNLVSLDVSFCYRLESLPEEIGDLENLENLDASSTLISRPPTSIVRLNKLNSLAFAKGKSDNGQVAVYFVFPPVAEGLRSLEFLNLNYCNLIDGGLPEDIGCLYSLKELYLRGNYFEHLPQSMAQLGALRSLDLSYCYRLKELPDFMGMPNLETLNPLYCMNLEEVPHSIGVFEKLAELTLTDCERLKRVPTLWIDSLKCLQLKKCSSLEYFPDIRGSMKLELEIHMLGSVIRDLNSFYNSFQLTLYQNDISISDSLSQRVFTILHKGKRIPSWFRIKGMDSSVSVNLLENWYVRDNFLGFAVCYSGCLIDTTAHLIPFCNDGMLAMTLELGFFYHLECDEESTIHPFKKKWDGESTIHFFLVPFASLWDASKANGKTPNDYGIIRLWFSGAMKEFGFRLLYKDELEIEALLQMRENNDESAERCTGIRRSRYDNEASCSSGKKQRSHSNIQGSSVFENLQQQVEPPVSSEILRLNRSFPEIFPSWR
ncbi:TMV resistance protein N-like [Nicotiana sylvestris]|uniref:ADP-ribosyl cyclase/cyclic ADP-ribose hydrolase n=1 Tax=Nicotiana tabacum TaxID=4097 RepID=A0A1S3X6C3_TOBAC|nr:PREDICTED: TMV resistance protein N-like [Nicotiana tabacum]